MCPWWVTCSMWMWGTSASHWPSWPGSMGMCSPCLSAEHPWWSSMTMTQSRNALTRQSSLADQETSQELSSRKGKPASPPPRENIGLHRENFSWAISPISQANWHKSLLPIRLPYNTNSFRSWSQEFGRRGDGRGGGSQDLAPEEGGWAPGSELQTQHRHP